MERVAELKRTPEGCEYQVRYECNGEGGTVATFNLTCLHGYVAKFFDGGGAVKKYLRNVRVNKSKGVK